MIRTVLITHRPWTLGVGLTLVLSSLVGGCPQNPGDGLNSGVTARITISATQGDRPLRVTVSGENSTSTAGAIAKYTWDFAGEDSAEGISASHTFFSPGRYLVDLTVVDAAGREGRARVTVRVHGGEVTALIGADRLSGAAPLTVSFDSDGSTAVDDTIFDYFWDFGDGETSRESDPTHTFTRAGSFIVSLRVVSAGGVEATTQTEVQVYGGATSGASLQFSGTQFASLPVASAGPLAEFTFEAWCKPDATGGTLVNFGVPGLAIDVLPQQGLVSLRTTTEASSAAASVPADAWRHIAVSYSSGVGASVYVDGALVGASPIDGQFNVALLSLGLGFSGKVAKVQFWGAARSASQVASDMSNQPGGGESGLLGAWALDEGAGQTLANVALSGTIGTLGASTALESGDPAWSTDAP